MAGFISWVDYSSAERQRVREAVARFQERETRDELGIGSIRDAISHALFPGTSIVQTRLAHALFVPWIYRDLEGRSDVRASNVESCARQRELDLIERLTEKEGGTGVFGSPIGSVSQCLPSSAYWAALHRWKIFTPDWSVDEYHRRWDQLREEQSRLRVASERGSLPGAVRTWHPDLPEAPAGFPSAPTFALRREDAVFLQDRIRDTCAGTLLAHAVALGSKQGPSLDAAAPWDAFAQLPSGLAHQVTIAQRFAELMQGAALVYNVALAERAGRSAFAERHLESVSAWSERAARARVTAFNLGELWELCAAQGANVGLPTRTFVASWQHLLRSEGFANIARSSHACSLIERRELELKGALSRFRDPHGIDVWNGDSKSSLLVYRWPTVRVFLGDLYAGLYGDTQQSLQRNPREGGTLTC